MRTCALFLLVAAAVAAPGFGSTDDRPPVVTVTLKDGGTLVGTVVQEDEASVTLRTASGTELKLPREAIASREARDPKARARTAASPLSDPNDSRLMFAPTGRPLGKGNGYFSDHYVLFPGFAYGLTKNLSVAGGISVVPALGISEQVFYASATSAWKLNDTTSFALGGLYAGGPDDEVNGGAALFGIATFGHSDRSLSLGMGWLAAREEEYTWGPRGQLSSHGEWRFRDAPVLMVGGSLRVARNLSLVSESWLFLGTDFDLSQQPFGLSLRFFSGRISADVGVVLVAEVLEEGLPVPWLSFSYHFGPSRKASSRSGSATPPWARTAARGPR